MLRGCWEEQNYIYTPFLINLYKCTGNLTKWLLTIHLHRVVFGNPLASNALVIQILYGRAQESKNLLLQQVESNKIPFWCIGCHSFWHPVICLLSRSCRYPGKAVCLKTQMFNTLFLCQKFGLTLCDSFHRIFVSILPFFFFFPGERKYSHVCSVCCS